MQIALQLYTVRRHTVSMMIPTLRRLALMGYRAVEFSGYGNENPRSIRATLNELQMRAVSAHIEFERAVNQPYQVISELHQLGCEYAVIPWLDARHRTSREAFYELPRTLNSIAKRFCNEGIRLCYHNHGFEFTTSYDGMTLWDLLAVSTDPELLYFECDLYWMRHAGIDLFEALEQVAGRTPLLHYKDMAAGATAADAVVGSGILPWPQLINASRAAGARWAVIEQDHAPEPFKSAEDGLRFLRNLL